MPVIVRELGRSGNIAGNFEGEPAFETRKTLYEYSKAVFISENNRPEKYLALRIWESQHFTL